MISSRCAWQYLVWIAQWLAYVVAGRIPDIGADPFRLVAALDLSLMSTSLAAGGILLGRRSAWGYLIASIAGIQRATYTLVLTAGSIVGARAGVQGAADQIPIWASCTLVTATAMGALLGSTRDLEKTRASGPITA